MIAVRERPPAWWVYGRGQWSGRLPSLGGDELGRCTVVFPLYFCTVVVAIPAWVHRCPDDEDQEEQCH